MNVLWKNIYRKIGVRTLRDLVSPIVIDSKDLTYARGSILFGVIDENIFPKPEDMLYRDNMVMHVVDDYGGRQTYKKNIINIKNLITSNKRYDDRFIIEYNVGKLSHVAYSKEIYCNMNALDVIYHYTRRPLEKYNAFYRKINSLIRYINTSAGTERDNLLIHLPIGNVIPPLKLFREMAHKHNPKKIEKFFNSNYEKFILMIYSYLYNEMGKHSPLYKLTDAAVQNTTLCVTHLGKVSLINLEYLLSSIKESPYATSMNKVKGPTLANLFLTSILVMRKAGTMSVDGEVRKGLTVEGINIIERDVKGDFKIVDKDIEKALETEILDSVTYGNNSDEVSSALVNRENDKIRNKTISEKYPLLNNAFQNGKISESKMAKQIEELENFINSDFVKKNKVMPEDIIIAKEDTILPDSNVVIYKSDLHDTIGAINKKYMKYVYEKDMANAVIQLSKGGIVISDYETTDIENNLGTSIEYKFKLKTIDGTTHSIKYILPKLLEDGSYMSAGNKYKLRQQKADLPIRKINNNIVAITSYVGKVFITKYYFSKDNSAVTIKKILTKRIDDEMSNISIVVGGESKVVDVKLPSQYTTIARSVSIIVWNGNKLSFGYHDRLDMVKDVEKVKKIENEGNVLIGLENDDSNRPIFMNMDNEIILSTGTIGTLFKELNIRMNDLPIEYATTKLGGKNIPLALPLIYYFGFWELLDNILKVTYTKYPKGTSVLIGEDEYKITLSDIVLVLKRSELKATIAIGGLSALKVLKDVTSFDLDNKDFIKSILMTLDVGKGGLIDMETMEVLFIDHITEEILRDMKEPTDMKFLLLRACELLVTDYADHPNNFNGMRIRGNERMSGLVYKTLIKHVKGHARAIGNYGNKIRLGPYDMAIELGADPTSMPLEDLNPLAAIKQMQDVTVTGFGGMAKESVVGIKREFHASEIGISSEANKDSPDIGLSSYLTANPRFRDIRGNHKKLDIDSAGEATIKNTTSLLVPCNDKDDSKRELFTGVQNGHVVGMDNQMILPYRTGYEAVIPLIVSDKFVIKASGDCIVTKVDSSEITIKYADTGEEIVHKAIDWTSKEEGGFTYTHVMKILPKKGDKLSKGDTIVYDSNFFGPDRLHPGRVAYMSGLVILVQYAEDIVGHEDSSGISMRCANKLRASTTYTSSYVFKNTDRLTNIVKVGDTVEYMTPIATVDDGALRSDDSLSSDALNSLRNLESSNPQIKHDGIVSKITVKHLCPQSTLSRSIKSIIKNNIEWNKDSEVISGYSIKGRKLEEGEVEIKIYVIDNKTTYIGDKFVIGSQLKTTIGDIAKKPLITENGDICDMTFSNESKDARIVNSADITGIYTTALVGLTEKVVDAYFY